MNDKRYAEICSFVTKEMVKYPVAESGVEIQKLMSSMESVLDSMSVVIDRAGKHDIMALHFSRIILKSMLSQAAHAERLLCETGMIKEEERVWSKLWEEYQEDDDVKKLDEIIQRELKNGPYGNTQCDQGNKLQGK